MVRLRNAPVDFGGRRGDWDRKARDDPVNKRIYDLFGLDSAGYCSRLAEIYRYQSDRLESRSKRIKTKQDLLSPAEFEDIVRFQPYLTEEFFNIHVLPYSDKLGDWTPRQQIPYYYRAEDLDWKNPKNSLIPEENSEILGSNSTDDDQNQRILEDFEDEASTVVASSARTGTAQTIEPIVINSPEPSVATPMEQDVIINVAVQPIPMPLVLSERSDIEKTQRKQTKIIDPKYNSNSQPPIKMRKTVPDSNYFKHYFKTLALPGALPDLDTCRRRDFNSWLKGATIHKAIDQNVIDECVKFIDDRRKREESSNSSQYSSTSKTTTAVKNTETNGQSNKERGSKPSVATSTQKVSQKEKKNGESSEPDKDDIGYMRNFLSSIITLPPTLLERSPVNDSIVKTMFEMVRETEAKARKSYTNKK